MKLWSVLKKAGALAIILMLAVPWSAFALVWTDLPDYTPGSTVTISGDNSNFAPGAGYLPGETVEVLVDGPSADYQDVPCLAPDPANPGQFLPIVVAADGSWSCQVVLLPDERAIGSYIYYATGLTSGVQEEGTFTDAPAHMTFTATAGATGGTFRLTYQNAGNQAKVITYTTPAAVDLYPNSAYTIDQIQQTVNGYEYAGPATVSGTAPGGNQSQTVTLVYQTADAIPPETTIAACPATPTSSTSASFSFSGTDNVTPPGSLSFECNLDGAGWGSCTSPASYSPLAAGSHTFQVRAKDAANNVDQSPASCTWLIDTAGPAANPSQAPAANAAGWNSTSVTVSWNWSDSGGAGLDTANCPATTDATAEGEYSVSATCKDLAGNSTTATWGIKIDKTAPEASPTQAPPKNAGGWNSTDVTVTWNWSDTDGSGLDGCSISSVASDEGQYDVTDTCQDVAGNSTTATWGVKIDKTAPSIECNPPSNENWYADNVTVNCTASDAGSGLADPADAAFSLSTSVEAGFEDAAASTGSKQVCDTLGQCSTAGPFTFKVDRKAPQLSGCDAPDGLWHAGDVTLYCTYTDGGSGPASQQVALTTSVAAGEETANAVASAGGVQACDGVGNCAASPADIAGNKVDRKAPQLSGCDAPDGLWHAGNVTLYCTYTDGGSGPASQQVALTTSVAAGVETANAAASANGAQACDGVGNCAASPADIAGNKVDRKAPTITITTPASGGVYTLNQAVAAAYTCADGGSGVATCVGPVLNGSNIDTSSIGPKAFTVNATDAVGNAQSATHAYSVIYNWTGFFQPVDNPGAFPYIINTVKAGSAIPVKFNLGGYQGLNIFAAGYPQVGLYSCPTGTEDPIEETVNAGGSSLTYDFQAMQYVYVWKTQKSWVGKCGTLHVTLTDGTDHIAYFKFK